MFTTIGGQPRSSIAVLSAQTGLAGVWNPSPDAPVNALLMSGSRLYVGGSFAHIGALPAAGIACTVPLEVVEAQAPSAPLELSLSHVRPNPTSGPSRIDYALVIAGQVRIAVYDLQGRLRAKLVDGWRAAGRHALVWDVRDNGLSAGMYFVRMQVARERMVRSVVVVR